ncbi:MAG: AMP-binding protein, partial [Anaerolineales bacterium]|nr:AMP-binding protein [Anaerolineales bacterium]
LGTSYPESYNDIDEWQDPVLSGDSLAYIQYTSGSTASPKGVMLNHSHVIHNLAQIQERLEIDPIGMGVLWGPLFHEVRLVFGILLALKVGGPLTFMPPIFFVQKPFRWLQTITKYGGTISGSPNFGYQLCVDRIPVEQRAKLDLSSWKIALCGAEPIRSDTLEQFIEAFSPYGFRPESFCPVYGLAEATLAATLQRRSSEPTIISVRRSSLGQNQVVEDVKDDELCQNFVSCGPALPGLDITIVDPDTLARCPPDQVGEIWVSGPSIAQGYWKRPEETEKTFMGHLPDAEGKSFLRTGDLGFFKDGMLFVTGRLKNLIIIRGSNYYPQDIELTTQQSHPALQPDGGAVFSIPIDDEEQLVVVHELKPAHRKADVEDVSKAIRIAIAEEYELPVYAVALVRSKTIPRTSSAKIQHHLCRSMFLNDQLVIIGQSLLEDRHLFQPDSKPKAILAPQTAVEEVIAEIWAQTLNVEPISLDDNFFELGGQSLLAIVVVSQLRERLRVDLPLRSIFDNPTINELAEYIEPLLGVSQIRPDLQPVSVARDGPLPLSYAQERMWFLHQLDSDNSAYNIPGALRLKGQLDWQAMERSYHTILQRYEALRTTFSEVDGRPVQVIEPFSKPVIKKIDLKDLTEDQRESQAIADAEGLARKPFDLNKGPLVRFCVIQLDDDDHLLVFSLHHIICDAWTLALLERELILIYNAYSSGRRIDLPEPRIQYADFAIWQRKWLEDEVFETQMKYWRSKLSRAPVVELHTDFPRLAVQTYSGAVKGFDISGSLLDDLLLLSHQVSVTLFMMLMAAFKVLLYRYTEQTDITIGVPIANRNWPASEPLIGTLVNTLLMRTDLSGNPTFRELLQQVREVSLEAYMNQDIPFAKLVADLQPERDLRHSPFAQIMFNVVETDMSPLDLRNLSATPIEIDRHGS